MTLNITVIITPEYLLLGISLRTFAAEIYQINKGPMQEMHTPVQIQTGDSHKDAQPHLLQRETISTRCT